MVKLPVRKLVPVATKAKASVPVATAKPAAENGPTKTVTVRMPHNHMLMLDNICRTYECDKSEALKKAIRLLNTALSGDNSTIVVEGAGKGEPTHIAIMKGGAPC